MEEDFSMKSKIRRAAVLFLSAMTALSAFVPAFADHIEPRPKDTVGEAFLEALPLIAFSTLSLVLLTGIILLIVFIVRKRNNKNSDRS